MYKVLILLAIAWLTDGCSPPLTAISVIDRFPDVKSLGPTIEGASVDKFGNLLAINQTHFMNLSDASAAPVLLGGNASFFSSSPEAKMLQPNDMAISADESRLYLSGMNYDADTGDLWFYDITQKSLHNIDLSGTYPKFFRTNGIELSPDDTELFISSAQNNPDETVRAAQIFRFQINNKTGIPEQPRVAIDLYETLDAMGLDPGASPGLDPDGMRCDVDGNLFISLNAFQSVLKWNIHADPATATVIKLETVQFPANLELAGSEGKDLFVIGQCSGQNSACVDHYTHNITGRAFRNLQA